MIQLFTHGTPNGHKIAIALEELDLPYEVQIVDVFAGAGQQPDFLKISPAGKIPAIVDTDNDRAVYESNAILRYLSQKAGALWPRSDAERTQAESLLFLQASLQGPMFGQRAHFSMFAQETVPYGIARYEAQGETVDEICERLLGARAYFLSSGYSIVDISFFAWYYAAHRSGYLKEQPERLAAWFRRVNDRPAVQRGIAATPVFPIPPRKVPA
ncbi:MAG: glutathione S-transferase family protein [Myxococcales bacterium FL481]|nr:MAG: glutathione S-transferase family protein [Myxococcales bacterium FL481]